MNKDRLLFRDVNQYIEVNVSWEVYQNLIGECVKAEGTETGGVLIGNYSEDQRVAYVKSATPPPIDSKHYKCDFVRGVSNLKNILDSAWEKGQYYIGEWHYHPSSSPLPSRTDRKQMMKLANNKKLNCPEPILIIIGGDDSEWSISMSMYNRDSETVLSLLKC